MAKPIEKQRLQAWIPKQLKKQLDDMAEARAMTITELVTQTLRDAVEKYERERYLIEVSKRDMARIMELLDNPPEPTAGLKALFEEHDEWVTENKRHAFRETSEEEA